MAAAALVIDSVTDTGEVEVHDTLLHTSDDIKNSVKPVNEFRYFPTFLSFLLIWSLFMIATM
jgi:hypothetical protein